MIDFQMKIFGFPLLGWICMIFIIGFLLYSYFSLRKKGVEKFGSCGGPKKIKKHLKPLVRPKSIEKKITLTCFYSDSCYYSKKMMGDKIIPGSKNQDGTPMKGEWNKIKNHCKKNNIKCLTKECDNNHLNRSLAAQMGVRGFPTCVMTFEDKVIKHIVGAKPAEAVIHEIEDDHEHSEDHASSSVPKKGMAIRTYYADWCYYSKLLMGHKIIPGSKDRDGNLIAGEWDKINAFCKANNIDCKHIETSSQSGKMEAQKLGIRGFPTTIIYKDGKKVDEIGGFMKADQGFIDRIKKNMNSHDNDHHHDNSVSKTGMSIKTYYADWCYYSKKLMGVDIVPSAKERDGTPMPGEWKKIKAFCDANSVDCSYVETSKGAGKSEAQKLGIDGFPTTLIYKNGKKVDEIGGYVPADGFIAMIKKNM